MYYIAAFVLLALSLRVNSAGAQVQLTITPVMTKGSASAPVTIVEFTDYQ